MQKIRIYPAGIYLLKVNNDNSRTRCVICSKLTKKALDLTDMKTLGNIGAALVSLLLTVNFEKIPHIFLVFYS